MIKLSQNTTLSTITRIITIINIITFCCYDYSVRIGSASVINRYTIVIEVMCNLFFGGEASINIIAYGLVFEQSTYLRSGWNIINFITFIAT